MELPFCPLPEHEVWAADVAYLSQTCFAGGCKEFWLVDPKTKTVQTWMGSGATVTYAESDSIPLDIMSTEPLPVSSFFRED